MENSIEEYVVDALIRYYNRDTSKFFEYMNDNIIWFGPHENQCMVGKDNILKAYEKFNFTVKFYIENITSQLLAYSQNMYTVIVTYRLYSKHPDGTIREHMQHVLLNGQKCRDHNGNVFWRCPFIHISDVTPNSDKSADISGVSRIISPSDINKTRIMFPGDDYTNVFLGENDINYIMGGKGVMCIIYTNNESYNIHMLLKDVMKKLPDFYYRCHASYIVNIKRIRSLSSHRIVMDNGTEIPIPVKRYSEIKKDINDKLSRL